MPRAKIPFFNARPIHDRLWPQIAPELAEVYAGGRFVLGPQVERFEAAFARYCQVSHCVACNSGTSALHLALRSLDIGESDEVITTPMTFVATAWAIQYVGARPVFADIDPLRRTVDVPSVEAAITRHTRAIIPVHLYGRPAEMTPLLELAARHGLAVIEDAAQAHGARYRGRRAGSLGVIGCFSFYPTKNLGACGEGGALVTDDPGLAARARAMRDHAQSERCRHESEGYNYRMDAWQGAVLGVKLPHLDDWNAQRRELAARYRQRLRDAAGLGFPDDLAALEPKSEEVHHLFVVETDDRDRQAARLRRAGVETGLHYPLPVHLQPAFDRLGYSLGDFPHAERLARRCLSLPLYPGLTPDEVDRVCEVLLETRRRKPRPGRRSSAIITPFDEPGK